MQELHSLHVPPYPDPYPSLTESPISDSTSQPPARSLTCMRPGLVLPVKQPPSPPPKSILVSVPVRHHHLSASVVVSQPNQVWWWWAPFVEGWSLTLKKSRCQRRTTSSPSALPSCPRLALRRHFLYNHSFFVLFCFCCPASADVISFLTFLTPSYHPLWPRLPALHAYPPSPSPLPLSLPLPAPTFLCCPDVHDRHYTKMV